MRLQFRFFVYFFILAGGIAAFVFYKYSFQIEKYLNTDSYCHTFSSTNCPSDVCEIYRSTPKSENYMLTINVIPIPTCVSK